MVRRTYIIILIILCYLSLGHTSVYLNTARIAFYNEKDYDRAKKACLQGIKTEQNNFELYAILGGSEIGLGNWQDASNALTKAFAIDSSKTLNWMSKKGGGEQYYYQAFFFSTRELYLEEELDRALADLEYARLLDPIDTGTYILRGAILYKLGRKEEANEEYRKVIVRDPENPDIHFLIGKSLFESKKFDSSLTYFESAVKYYTFSYDRSSLVIFQNLPAFDKELAQNIMLLWSEQKLTELDKLIKVDLGFEQGLDVHRRNIEQFVKTADALSRNYYFTGMAYYYLNEDSLALKNLLRSLELKSDDLDAFYFTGEVYIKLKGYQDAIVYFEKLTQLKEDDLYAWFYLGVCYTQTKEYNKAIDIYENRVLQLNPEHIDAVTNLAFVYGKIGNNKKALEYLMRAEKLQKQNK